MLVSVAAHQQLPAPVFTTQEWFQVLGGVLIVAVLWLAFGLCVLYRKVMFNFLFGALRRFRKPVVKPTPAPRLVSYTVSLPQPVVAGELVRVSSSHDLEVVTDAMGNTYYTVEPSSPFDADVFATAALSGILRITVELDGESHLDYGWIAISTDKQTSVLNF